MTYQLMTAAFFAVALIYFNYLLIETPPWTSTTAALFTTTIFFIDTLTFFVLHRLFLHPLSKYPGPISGRLTDWYSVYHCVRGDRHLNLERLHRRYGKIVRYGPNRISVNSASALQSIYSTQANTKKAEWYTVWKQFFKTDMSMSTIDRQKHAVKRRIVTKALNSTAVPQLEEKILRNVRQLCRSLAEPGNDSWSDPKDMTRLVAYCTSDIMGDTTFSRNWNMLRSNENHDIFDLLPRGVGGLSMVGHMPAIIKLGIVQIFRRDLVRDTYRFEKLSKEISDWRMEQPKSESEDFYGALLAAKDPKTGNALTRDELIAETGLLIVAGSDTMATAVTSAIFYLLHYPETLQRLQRDIRGTFADVEEICIGPQLSGCHYLTACIDEAMRLSPGVGSVLQREVLPGGLRVEEEWFPPGTDIAVPHYALHHNEDYHNRPYEFVPERWLTNERLETEVELTRSAYCPFGVGRASCVGKAIAYYEMTIMLARIVWLYDMRLQPACTLGEGHERLGEGRSRKREFQTWDSFVSTHEGPMVQFKPGA